jgi:hypothetical protein
MGLFTRKKFPTPVIDVSGLRVWYDVPRNEWGFWYSEIGFRYCGAEFCLPTTDRLEQIVKTLERLLPDVRRRCREYWTPSPHMTAEEATAFSLTDMSIELTDDPEVSFDASISGLSLWGDMMASFRISNDSIVEEEWGD